MTDGPPRRSSEPCAYGGLATFAAAARQLRAGARRAGRFVFVLLRGGFDGLAAVVPVRRSRRTERCAARSRSTSRTSSRSTTCSAWRRGSRRCASSGTQNELVVAARDGDSRIARAATSTARRSSRPGIDRPAGSADGWLNRLLQVMSGERSGIAIAAGHAALADRVVRGADLVADAARRRWTTRSWSGWRCCTARDARCTAASRRRMQQQETRRRRADGAGRARGAAAIAPLMRAAARILRQDDGPNIAAMEFSGWDTHANQGLAGGALDRLLGQLAEGLVTLPHRDGTGVGEHHGRRHDGVRPHGAAQRHARHRSRHGRRRIRARAAGGALDECSPTGRASATARSSKDAI